MSNLGILHKIKETQQGTLFSSNAVSAVIDIGNLSRRTQLV